MKSGVLPSMWRPVLQFGVPLIVFLQTVFGLLLTAMIAVSFTLAFESKAGLFLAGFVVLIGLVPLAWRYVFYFRKTALDPNYHAAQSAGSHKNFNKKSYIPFFYK